MNDLLSELKNYKSRADTFNPWADYDPIYDATTEAPAIRLLQLEKYLSKRIKQVKFILVAEAVGYQGGKFSGIPLTSERILLNNQKDIPANLVLPNYSAKRTSSQVNAPSPAVASKGFTEPTATIVWGLLNRLPISSQKIILWNIFPFHPFQLAKGNLSNRTPRAEELEIGLAFFKQLLQLCPEDVKIITIGRKSYETLDSKFPTVRHPAQGGAKLFREQLPPLIVS